MNSLRKVLLFVVGIILLTVCNLRADITVVENTSIILDPMNGAIYNYSNIGFNASCYLFIITDGLESSVKQATVTVYRKKMPSGETEQIGTYTKDITFTQGVEQYPVFFDYSGIKEHSDGVYWTWCKVAFEGNEGASSNTPQYQVDLCDLYCENITPAPNSILNSKNATISATFVDPVVNGYASGVDITLGKTKIFFDGSDITEAVRGAYATLTEGVFSHALADLADGVHTVKVEGWDKAGNISNTEWHFTTDTTPPVIKPITVTPLLGPGGSWNGDTMIVGKMEWSIDPYTNQPSYKVPVSKSIDFEIPYEDPVPGSGINAINVSVSVSGDGVQVTNITKDATKITFHVGNLSWGKHVATVSVWDLAGNEKVYTFTFYIWPDRTVSFNKYYISAAKNPGGDYPWFHFGAAGQPWQHFSQDVLDYYAGKYCHTQPLGVDFIGATNGQGFFYKGPITEWGEWDEEYPDNAPHAQEAGGTGMYCGLAEGYLNAQIAYIGDYQPGQLTGFSCTTPDDPGNLFVNIYAMDYCDNITASAGGAGSGVYNLGTQDVKEVAYIHAAITARGNKTHVSFTDINLPAGNQNNTIDDNLDAPQSASLLGINKQENKIKEYDESNNLIKELAIPSLIESTDVVKYGTDFYVADCRSKSIIKFDTNGAQTGALGTGLFTSIGTLGINKELGRIYALDLGDENTPPVVRVFSIATGSQLNAVGSGLNNPRAVSADTEGNIYIADTGNNRVVVYDAYGNARLELPASAGKAPEGGAVEE